MSNTFRPSASCCSRPKVIGPPYEYKGDFVEVDGTKTYITGREGANKALFVLYDIFGFSAQIFEGADKLAAAGYCVFMPGFFGDDPAPMSWMPLAGPADEDKMDEFCEGPGDTERTIERMSKLRAKFQEMNPSIERWGLIGFCWGGYVIPFALGDDTPFKACAALHPGFPGTSVAEKVSVPYMALCSQDEPQSMWELFDKALTIEHKFVEFPNMVHGWLSARSDLSNPKVREEFDAGYQLMIDWFGKHM